MKNNEYVQIRQCDHCGCISRHEEEVTCWECGMGKMIYLGEFRAESDTSVWSQVNTWWNQTAPEDFTLNFLGVIFWGAIIGVAFGMVFLFG